MSPQEAGSIILDTLIDTLKLLPLLFLAYLGMEFLEGRAGEKTLSFLARAGRKGPLIGGALGAVPQCGFSAAAANFYAGGVITAGTLVAVFLSTSDEMLAILISERAAAKTVLLILAAKMIYGTLAGFLVDLIAGKRKGGSSEKVRIREICERDNCKCGGEGVARPAIIHTLKTAFFVFATLLVIQFISELVGMERLIEAAASFPVAGIFLMGLIGMIPSCAVSVAITTFYLEGALSFGSMFAGLCSCAGLGTLVLIRSVPDKREVVKILGIVYVLSVAGGLIAELIA